MWFVLMQCSPRIAPCLPTLTSLDNRLSITISLPLLALLLEYASHIYSAIGYCICLSQMGNPNRWCHKSFRHFCWGAVVFIKGGLGLAQVQEQYFAYSFPLRSLANGTTTCPLYLHNVVRKPRRGYSDGLRGRKTGGFSCQSWCCWLATSHWAC